MIVQLLAHTAFVGDPSRAGWVYYTPNDSSWITEDADSISEFAGRLCYQSWDRPNPATATNQLYLANIILQQHFSVLEHASATFYVAEVSRAFSHELVRHRHLSFSQVSQRYVDESNGNFVVNRELDEAAAAGEVPLGELGINITEAYKKIVEVLIARGRNRKEARQVARLILPNLTETKLVVTGNMRAWREFILKRNSVHADKEIMRFAQKVLEHLKNIAPNTFQDM